MSSPPSVDISTAGKFHAYHLASELAALGRLGDLYSAHRSIGPPKKVSRSAFHNRIDLALWGLASRHVKLGYSEERKNCIFDKWVARQLIGKRNPRILHGWNGCSSLTFRMLRDSGWLLCVERSCPHNLFQANLIQEEASRIGVEYQLDSRTLEKDIEELHMADIIVVPSLYSAKSYADSNLQKKLRVNSLGANFSYSERKRKSKGLKVLMVGNMFLRKGTHYLIEAFKCIARSDAELWIRGDIPNSYRTRITDPRIKLFPPLSATRLRDLYKAADVFVQPSVDEGFGMTVLEALACGVPTVITENVGVRDILNEDVSITVPIRDPQSIVTAIEKAQGMHGEQFDIARKKVLEGNTWRACAERMLSQVYIKH